LRDSCRIDVIPVVVSASPLVVEDCKDQLLKEVSKEPADAVELIVILADDITRFASLDPNMNCKLKADRVAVEGLVRYSPRGIGVAVGVSTSYDELESGDDMTLVVQNGVTCSFGFLSGGSIVVEEL
jgi:hypothetical protein